MANEKNSLLTEEEIQGAFHSSDAARISKTLVDLALYDPDWKKVQTYCLEFLEYPDAGVRAVAATCIGHLARIHKHLDLDLVVPALYRHQSDTGKYVAGNVDNALSSIERFMGVEVRRDPSMRDEANGKVVFEEDDEDEQPPSDQEVQQAFESGNSLQIEQVLTGLSLYDPNWRKTEQYCVQFLNHPNSGVRETAVECLNRVLYEHKQLDLDIVLPVLNALRSDSDPHVVRQVGYLLRDITTILHVPVEPIASTDYIPVGPLPTDGQRALNNSVSIDSDKQNRIGIDEENEEIVVFGRSDAGTYAGDVRTWNQLTDAMKTTLIEKGLITEQGNIILRDKRGNIIRYGKNVKQDV